uniref:bifunctional [glutamate--ammonia ligase]-adenylyl-L-tyrosine phosphorylase/[glutamate--ammonia-ligase] adenylyltransferase n=1 Tax=Salinimonas lutimaris TaxID=914153 RepID=UPI0010BFDE25
MPTQIQMNRIIEQKGQALWQRFCESNDADDYAEYQTHTQAVFGLSPFVAEHCIRHPEWLRYAADNRLPVSGFASELRTRLNEQSTEDAVQRELRQFRNRAMCAIAWQDLTHGQSIEDSLKQVSALANALIYEAYHWHYEALSQRYGVPAGPYGAQPMLMLAMGKLGGGELNFSSDIDLIFCYPYKGETEGARKTIENQQFFTKLAQRLIAALNKITVDGQVFRVDMRLRPFGDSGPLVTHLAAMEDYYQEQGRAWERFAMIKARIINPEDDYTRELKDILRPFTYRRYLDFTTIDALRHMKGLINREIRRRGLTNNIKLGPGGIREVEFFAQSFQLIHGGREPALQCHGLKATLDGLAELDIVEAETLTQMYDHYLFLRKTEHTLQQFNDEQTQTLPDDEWQQAVVAQVTGFHDYSAFKQQLNAAMSFIHDQFNELVEVHDEEHGDTDDLYVHCKDAWQVDLDEQEFCLTLQAWLPAEHATALFARLTSFRAGLRQFRLGERGASTLDELMPELLHTVISAGADKPVELTDRVLRVVSAITGRTTYLNLLLENLDVLRQLVRLCERSDWIAEQISRFPLLLDELLTPLYLQQQNTSLEESRAEYTDELRQQLLRIDPDDVEQIMDNCRQFKLCQQLRIAASDISGSLPINKVSDKLTVLAEVLLDTLIFHAFHQISQRFGIPEHLQSDEIGFGVIGYGKLGGYELGYGSDLDLVFIHNAPRSAVTNGKKQIEAQQFYIKLAQRVMHLLSTTTLFGQLYETDLRLRPSGAAGLLCCHIDGFETYQHNEAWTWEHQALVRARGVAGDKALLNSFDDVRKRVLTLNRDKVKLAEDVTSMRQKMRAHLDGGKADTVDLKQCEGGITDIEFMAQYWVLAHASDNPSLTVYPDNLRILDAVSQAGLLETGEVAELQNAYLTLRDYYHQLTLADSKYAQASDTLDALRNKVRTRWKLLFE